jgi:phosphoenolpyruvate carboxykinase (diphosphate)
LIFTASLDKRILVFNSKKIQIMYKNLKETIGYCDQEQNSQASLTNMIHYINIKLSALDLPIYGKDDENPFLELGKSLLATAKAKDRLLADYMCPVDKHIHQFVDRFFKAHGIEENQSWLPRQSFVLDRHGIARALSIPPDRDDFKSDIIESYRTANGVLHNPKHDRRTTKGVFHVCEGGLPIPNDKKSVPVLTFSRLLKAALNPPKDLLELPFTSNQEQKAAAWVSLLLRPLVCPAVSGITGRKTMEVRFFAPGNMVANLDFVESIFGNAGNPLLPENDARLDTSEWSGHTGCVILAPHLLELTKKELGLPHVDDASARQKRDGMCWADENEKYNDGTAFKVTLRNQEGVIVTLIADNYFGYCKKEVKTQLSYAANLYGLVEEEHAGGALTFPSFDLGEDFRLSFLNKDVDHTFTEVAERHAERLELQPEGYAIDKNYPDIVYVPENSYFELRSLSIQWENEQGPQQIKLNPDNTYLLPSGYKVKMLNPQTGQRWRLTGTNAEGLLCHKPCTVSGGGKSEISKPITDAMVNAPVFTPNFEADMDMVEAITRKDYSNRFTQPNVPGKPSRPLLSNERSLGSVVRLLTPNPEYTEEFNEWLATIPHRVRDLVLTVKRFYRPHWGDNWRERFNVDTINGQQGVELRYRQRQVIGSYVRLGYTEQGAWRLFSLRKDFWPASKLQREDDITSSVVVPNDQVKNLPGFQQTPSSKFVENCEYRLFQRPDDAIIPGYDKHTEYDYACKQSFFSNYEPLTRAQVELMVQDVIKFEQYTPEMQKAMRDFVEDKDGADYFVSNNCPRIVDGAPTKNPRYLQNRPDLGAQREEYLADLGIRLYRRLPENAAVFNPVGAVLPGRRNNPPDVKAGIRPLAVYNPIHYQELPELFMDFVASLTGKSPSTTGAGSEGALTKAPFNALLPITDLNNALISYILTQSNAFSTAAGYVGHKYRVDHDISLLVPELWCRMYPHERDPKWLIKEGYLEALEDFEYNGETVPASRLGYRITKNFALNIFGRIFSHPDSVLNEEMLKPELQSMAYYVDGIANIVEAQKKSALNYFEDGGIDLAIPPMKALLHIMAYGNYEGKDLHHPDIRGLFTLESVLESDWYAERLQAKVNLEISSLKNQANYLNDHIDKEHPDNVTRLSIRTQLNRVNDRLAALEKDPESFLKKLKGTLGCDPSFAL